MLDPSDIQLKNTWTDEEVDDYFYKLGKLKLTKDPQFLSKLKGIDLEKVDSGKIKRIKKMIQNHPKRSKEWVKQDMKNSNLANFCIFLVVDAAFKYNELFLKTEPLRAQYQSVMNELDIKQKLLQEKNNELSETEMKLQDLELMLKVKSTELSTLRNKLQVCAEKLFRAKKLTDLLSDENERWSQDILSLRNLSSEIEGNAALSSSMISYVGAFTNDFRGEIEQSLLDQLKEYEIPIDCQTSLIKFMGNPIQIQQWSLNNLPKDDNSIQNGIIMDNSQRWIYVIDPQKQGFKFLKNQAKSHLEGFDILKANHPNLLKALEICVQNGKQLILEDCSETLDLMLEPILQKNIIKQGGSLQIQLGDKMVSYGQNFKLFMVTNISNPQLSPELCAKVCVINFGVTKQGLIEQMLATIVILENRKLEDQKNQIVKKNAEDKNTLFNIENQILKTLSESEQSSFLESSELIDQLVESKKTSSQIKQRVIDSRQFEQKIDEAREDYRPLAVRVSVLFFTIKNLSIIETMYEFSLEWFENLFRQNVETAPASNALKERLDILT